MMANIKLNSSLFGNLEYDTEEGLWEYFDIALEGNSYRCRLDIESDLENSDLVQKLIEAIPQMISKAKAAFLCGYPEDETIAMFVDFQIEQIDAGVLMDALCVQTEAEITPQNFLSKLRLTGVSINYDSECVMDFCLDEDVTDALLVVTFDETLEILGIEHES